jgi:protein SCO1
MATRADQTRLRTQALLAGAILILCFSALAATTVFVLRAVSDKPAGLSTVAIGGPFRLQASTGGFISADDLKGKPFLLFFGYTHCPDVCPTTLAEMSDLVEDLRKGGRDVQAFFVSVDPERDTPEVLRDYLSSFGDTVVGLTGSREEIDRVVKSYRAFAECVPRKDGDYAVNHTANVYLMGAEGHLLGLLAPQEPREAQVAKLKRLLG